MYLLLYSGMFWSLKPALSRVAFPGVDYEEIMRSAEASFQRERRLRAAVAEQAGQVPWTLRKGQDKFRTPLHALIADTSLWVFFIVFSTV